MKRSSVQLHLERLEDRTVPSSPGDIDWLRQFGSGFGDSGQGLDPARAAAVDANGNVYVAGDLPHILPGQISAGGIDAYVRKHDAAGNELWTRQFGTSGRDQAIGVAVAADGVYVVGRVADALPGQTRHGFDDAFVRKYDTNGNELWTRQFGTTHDGAETGAFAVAVDASGVYLGGSVRGALPGQTATGGTDAFVRKYDLAGNELWTRQFGTFFSTFVDSVAVDASGVYVGGEADGALPGQVSTGRFIGDADAFVRKYDANGTELWTREFSGGDDDINQRVASLSADASGVYVVGETRGTLPGQTNVGGDDAFVRKYDSAGNELWTHQFGTDQEDITSGVSANASGVYVVGVTSGAFPGAANAGITDAFVRKYDAAGNELWTRQFGGAGFDEALGVVADASGVYVAGSEGDEAKSFVRKYDFNGTDLWTRQFGTALDQPIDAARAVATDGNVYVAGDVTANLTGQTAAGDADAFVRKYDAAGNELWTRQFGTSTIDQALAVGVDGLGVYVAGYTAGALPGASTAGGPDAFVRKYDLSGNLLWTRQFGTAGTDAAFGLVADGTGVYVTGDTTGTLPGQSSTGGFDAFVRKYDADGNESWTRQFGTSGTDQGTGIAVDATGVYVSGITNGAFAGQTNAGGEDAFVRKYDAAGNELWTRQFGASSSDRAFGVAAGSSGVYVAGRTVGALAGQTGAGLTDAFVRKYDANGIEIWTRQFGTAGADQALGVAVGTSGIYVTGSTEGALPGQTSAGLEDAFLRKYDANGNVLWTRQYGTSGADSAAGVAVSAAGLFIVGTTDGEFPGQTSAGGQDAFVAKIVDGVVITPTSTGLASSANPSVFGQSVTVTATVTATDGGSGTPSGTVQFRVDGSDFGSPVSLVNGAASISTDGLSVGPHTITAVYGGDDSFSTSTSDAFSQVVNQAATATAASVSAPTPLAGVDAVTLSAVVSVVAPGSGNPTGTVTFYDGAAALGTANLVDGAASLALGNTALAAGSHTIRANYNGDDNFQDSDSTATVNVLAPSTIQGLVYIDFNNDGQVDFGERAVPGVTVTLTGTDDLGHAVSRTVLTDANGVYAFIDLRPSNAAGYTLTETQPAGLLDGRDTLGTVNGVPTGSAAVNDTFSGVALSQGGSFAENYNFGERPATNGGVAAGQTAGIGYWQNPNGQNLVRSLNGGATATQLGHWLAVTFPNMYGALDGVTNAGVAAFYKGLFARTARTAPGGPPKVDAQIMATALAVYVTNQTLAGTTATAYGFQVTANGVGAQTFNVGCKGAGFGAANNTSLSIMDLLLAVNARAHNGLLYDLNGNGHVDGSEASYRTMANDVFAAINEAGDI